MNANESRILYLYQFFCIIFLLLTTKYLNIHDIINIGGQMDAISYTEIAEQFPTLPHESDAILKNLAQRFVIPYAVGSISKLFNIDLILVFRIFTITFVLLYIYLITFFANKLKFSLRESVLFFSFLVLNPYITRYHLFNPMQSHDMLFFCLCILFTYSVIKNKFILNIFATVVTIFLRQTSIALFFSSLVYLIFNKKVKLILLLCSTYFLSLLIIVYVGKYISTDTFPFQTAYRLFFYDFTQIETLLRFALLPLLSFFPLFLFFLSKVKKNIDIKIVLVLLIPCIMMIAQPYLGGPTSTGRNIVRITTLCYPILTILIFYSFDLKKIINNNLIFFPYLFSLFFWSLHPTFSIFKFFGVFRFFNY